MAFTRPTLGALIRDTQGAIAARLPGTDPTLRRSNLGILGRVFAGLVHLVFGYLDWIFRQVIPDTSEGEYLERWCRIYGIARKPAAAATGSVTLSGDNGTTLAAGAALVRSDGLRFLTTANATIAAGTATVAVAAEAGGIAGNTDAGAGLGLVIAVAGLYGSATVAAGGLAGGAEAESDAELRGRLLAHIRQPPQGGAQRDYVAWALEVPGVTRAWCYPQGRGAGTVDLAFVMDGRAATGGSIIPTTGDVAAVQVHVDDLRPVTDDFLAFAPTPVALDVTITNLATDGTAVRAAIRAELSAQILLDAEPGGTVYRSRLIEAISRATGESHHAMTLPAADVASPAGSMSIPGTVTFA